ncbi:MAG: hypothetical protein JW734_06550 [Candidatus Omnitrophica bacterium]|nr:hypothetical protein [Candidatus Omnitrophota bacterium]
MSIYDTEQVKLPQVKVSEWQKSRLYGFLKIFNRKYATFIRDVCDAIISNRMAENFPTFIEYTDRVSRDVFKQYLTSDFVLYKAKYKKERVSIGEQIGLHNFPTKKIERLPKVMVSKWQADNLNSFLAKFARDYADFVRMLCDNIVIDCIEAQAEMMSFSKKTREIFMKVFDEIIGMEEFRPKLQKKREWPTEYWAQRQVIKNRNKVNAR